MAPFYIYKIVIHLNILKGKKIVTWKMFKCKSLVYIGIVGFEYDDLQNFSFQLIICFI